MPEITERLSTALADRYAIERQLGEGGMATVYLAEDLKHKRKVAVKVLKPELAAVLGAERFVQEITTTAFEGDTRYPAWHPDGREVRIVQRGQRRSRCVEGQVPSPA